MSLLSLLVAAIVAGVVLLVAGMRSARRRATHLPARVVRPVRAKYRSERRALGLVAVGLVVAFCVDTVLRDHVLDLTASSGWWRFATAPAVASLGLAAVVALIALRGSAPSEAPAVTGMRRTWWSFGPRAGLIGAAVLLVVLVATTVAAGLGAFVDGRGRSMWLEVPVPNQPAIDPIRLPFYGWEYGVPVLVCVTALVALTGMALHRNAVRPYIRPETVGAEKDARRDSASAVVGIASAAVLLALAGAWRLISAAGSVSRLFIDGQNHGAPYVVIWRYADLALAVGWLAPVLEVSAFVILLLIAVRLLRRHVELGAAARLDPVTAAEARA